MSASAWILVSQGLFLNCVDGKGRTSTKEASTIRELAESNAQAVRTNWHPPPLSAADVVPSTVRKVGQYFELLEQDYEWAFPAKPRLFGEVIKELTLDSGRRAKPGARGGVGIGTVRLTHWKATEVPWDIVGELRRWPDGDVPSFRLVLRVVV